MLTYDFQTLIRDLSPVIDIIIANSPTFLSLVGDGDPARNTKHEYLTDELNPYRDPVAVTFATGDTTLVVTDGTKFRVNDIIGFCEDTGEQFLETVRVTAINGNDLTVVRQYNGLSKVEVAVADIAIMVQRPNVENTIGGQDEGQDRATGFNYTQIFKKFATVSRTKQQVATYGIDASGELNHQMKLRLTEMVLEFERALLLGTKYEGTKTVPRTAGGIITEILQNSAAMKKNVNGAFSGSHIDDAVEEIFTASGINADTIVCHPKMSRKISAIDTSGLQILRGDETTGHAVFKFRSGVPIPGIQNIVVNNQFPVDQILISTTPKIKKSWMQKVTDEDATQKGQDGVSRVAVAELTFEFKNIEKCHKLLYNINLT